MFGRGVPLWTAEKVWAAIPAPVAVAEAAMAMWEMKTRVKAAKMTVLTDLKRGRRICQYHQA
jgi:hypothetical protein